MSNWVERRIEDALKHMLPSDGKSVIILGYRKAACEHMKKACECILATTNNMKTDFADMYGTICVEEAGRVGHSAYYNSENFEFAENYLDQLYGNPFKGAANTLADVYTEGMQMLLWLAQKKQKKSAKKKTNVVVKGRKKVGKKTKAPAAHNHRSGQRASTR